MKLFNRTAIGLAVATAMLLAAPLCVTAETALAPAASTPTTPKNWAGPGKRIHAQALVDGIAANHPELVSITIHAIPPGGTEYTMIAGTFPDRIGNTSSPGDVITAKKGVSQVESKWGTPDYGKKVSTVLPLRDTSGDYLPVAMVLAFKQSPDSGKKDTDFLEPGIRIRDALNSQIPNAESLFEAAK